MKRTLVKLEELEVDGQRCALAYYEEATRRGAVRFSCEVRLGPGDQIIVDDDSLPALQSRVRRLVPAMMHSRVLAAPPGTAA
jgi:hypothetical protein